MRLTTCSPSMLLELQWIPMEFIDDSDITLIVEIWEHDTQRNQGLGNYNVHSLI